MSENLWIHEWERDVISAFLKERMTTFEFIEWEYKHG